MAHDPTLPASLRQAGPHADDRPASTVIDPVCGMTVDPHTATHRHTHLGRPYAFCSAGCREKFAADPMRYLAAEARPIEPVPPGTIYTCPMHP
jgi:P-type Cu+ transporter